MVATSRFRFSTFDLAFLDARFPSMSGNCSQHRPSWRFCPAPDSGALFQKWPPSSFHGACALTALPPWRSPPVASHPPPPDFLSHNTLHSSVHDSDVNNVPLTVCLLFHLVFPFFPRSVSPFFFEVAKQIRIITISSSFHCFAGRRFGVVELFLASSGKFSGSRCRAIQTWSSSREETIWSFGSTKIPNMNFRLYSTLFWSLNISDLRPNRSVWEICPTVSSIRRRLGPNRRQCRQFPIRERIRRIRLSVRTRLLLEGWLWITPGHTAARRHFSRHTLPHPSPPHSTWSSGPTTSRPWTISALCP